MYRCDSRAFFVGRSQLFCCLFGVLFVIPGCSYRTNSSVRSAQDSDAGTSSFLAANGATVLQPSPHCLLLMSLLPAPCELVQYSITQESVCSGAEVFVVLEYTSHASVEAGSQYYTQQMCMYNWELKKKFLGDTHLLLYEHKKRAVAISLRPHDSGSLVTVYGSSPAS